MSHERVKTVVFICSANYYRSRFSEHLFNALAQERGLPWQATSRGLNIAMADGYGPISRHTVKRLAARGIELEANPRFPIALTEEVLENADLVVAVKEAEHRAMMLEQFPQWADRIQSWHVDDLDCAHPDEALPMCEACVEALVERLVEAEAKECEKDSTRLRRAG